MTSPQRLFVAKLFNAAWRMRSSFLSSSPPIRSGSVTTVIDRLVLGDHNPRLDNTNVCVYHTNVLLPRLMKTGRTEPSARQQTIERRRTAARCECVRGPTVVDESAKGACTRDPDRWTTTADEGAKALCRACPLRWRCAQEACIDAGRRRRVGGHPDTRVRPGTPVRAQAAAVAGGTERIPGTKDGVARQVRG